MKWSLLNVLCLVTFAGALHPRDRVVGFPPSFCLLYADSPRSRLQAPQRRSRSNETGNGRTLSPAEDGGADGIGVWVVGHLVWFNYVKLWLEHGIVVRLERLTLRETPTNTGGKAVPARPCAVQPEAFGPADRGRHNVDEHGDGS